MCGFVEAEQECGAYEEADKEADKELATPGPQYAEIKYFTLDTNKIMKNFKITLQKQNGEWIAPNIDDDLSVLGGMLIEKDVSKGSN